MTVDFKKSGTVNNYGERTKSSTLEGIPCIADGSKSVQKGDKGNIYRISYVVQTGPTPEISEGDVITELKLKNGTVLFTNGVIRRVSKLLDMNLGIVGQNLSIQVQQ